MILSKLFCVLKIALLSVLFIDDEPGLFSHEEKALLNDRFQLLESNRNIRIDLVTTLTLGDSDGRLIISNYLMKLKQPEIKVDSALLILLVADEGLCYFFSGTDGRNIEIPEDARFAIEEYGFTLLRDGVYYQGIENTVDGLLNKWGGEGEFRRDDGPIKKKNTASFKMSQELTIVLQFIFAVFKIIAFIGITLFLGTIIYLIIVMIKR